MPEQNTSSPTPSGRAVSALNHLTHGGTSQTLFLKDEDADEFFALLEDAFKYHSPTNSQDAGLVTDTVLARWFLIRRQQTHMYYEAKLHERKPLSTYWVQPERLALQRERFELAKAAKRNQAETQQNREEQEDQMKSNNQSQTQVEEIEKIITEVTAEVWVNQFGASIPQDVYVSVEDGVAKVFDFAPKNHEVQRIIGNADQYQTPPTKVSQSQLHL